MFKFWGPGQVKRPGDGTGSNLDAVMYLGLMEMPPATLSGDDLKWLDAGGKICWVYSFHGENHELIWNKSTNQTQSDPNGWVKVVAVCDGDVRYMQDSFSNLDYMKLVEELRVK